MKKLLFYFSLLPLLCLLLCSCMDAPSTGSCSHRPSGWLIDDDGANRYTQCLLCGRTLRTEPLPTVQCSHIFSVWLEEPEKGLRIKQCKSCNEILETQPLTTACPHRFTHWTEEPATVPGGDIRKQKLCSACGEVLETTTVASPLTTLAPCYGLTYIQNCDGAYLMRNDTTAFTGTTPTQWLLESCQEDQFFLKEPSGLYMLEYWYGTFQMAYDSGYTEQLWIPQKDASGAYLLVHAAAPNYCLRSQPDGGLTRVPKSTADERCFWQIQTRDLTKGYPYIEINGQRGIITLQLEPRVLNILTRGDLLRWANDLENAFDAYAELTGWKPFDHLTVRGYAVCHDWGYVHYEKPIIHANKDWLYEDLVKKSNRDTDMVWGILHEMSHLFDRPKWHFEPEALAAYKILYVLQRCNSETLPGEYDTSWHFAYQDMDDAFYRLCGKLAADSCPEGYPPLAYPLAGKLFEITKTVGWEAVGRAFRSMPDTNGMTQMQIFETFIAQLSGSSGVNVRALFTDKEWRVVEKYLP